MKRYALLSFCVGVTVGIAACSGPSTAAPSPGPTATVTVTPTAGSSGVSSPATAPAGKDAAAVATNYYRTIVARDYRLAFTYLAANATGPAGRRLTLQAFLQLAHTMDNQEGPVINFSVAAFPSITVMTVNRKQVGPYHAHLQMARYGDGWTIISIDRI